MTIEFKTNPAEIANYNTFKNAHNNASSCMPGSGWLSAQWIKIQSRLSGVSVVDKLYEGLKENHLDGQTLRWFSTTDLNGLFDKIKGTGNSTPAMSQVFDNAFGFALKAKHKEEKQAALASLYKAAMEASAISAAAPQPGGGLPTTTRLAKVLEAPQITANQPTKEKEPTSGPTTGIDLGEIQKKALAMQQKRNTEIVGPMQPQPQGQAQAPKFFPPKERYGTDLITEAKIKEAFEGLRAGKIGSISELGQEIQNNLRSKKPSKILLIELARGLTSCSKDEQVKKVFNSFTPMQQLWIVEVVISKHKEKFIDLLATNLKSMSGSEVQEIKEYVKTHKSTAHEFKERYQDLSKRL